MRRSFYWHSRLTSLSLALMICSGFAWADDAAANIAAGDVTGTSLKTSSSNAASTASNTASKSSSTTATNTTAASSSNPETAATQPVRLQAIQLQAQPQNAPDNDISAVGKTIINQAEMLQYGDQSVSDSLRRAAGITLPTPGSGPRGGGGAGAARFRGGAPTFLINGEPVQGGPRGGMSIIDTLSPDMIERIEVTKQPSVAQASVASSAVINIVLKQPLEDKLNVILRAGYGVRDSGQQEQKQTQLSGQFDGRSGAWGYSVSAQQMQNDSTSLSQTINALGESNTLQHYERTMRMFSPRLEYQLDDENKVVADLFVRDHQTDGERNGQIQQDRSSSVRLNTRYERKVGDDTDKIRLSLEQQNEKQSTRGNSFNNESREDLDEYALAYDGLRRFTDDIQLKFGADARQSNLSGNSSDDLDERRVALYSEGSWRFLPQHTATLGLRQEFLDRSGLVNYNEQNLSPVLAYRFQYDDAWSLQSNLSQAFQSPKADRLNPSITVSTDADAGSINNPDRGGNPNLKPEIIRAFESTLGYNQAKGGINLTGFYRDTQDYIERVVALEGSRYVERPQNQSSATSYGVELSGRYALKQTAAGHGFMLNAQLATIRAKIDSDNRERLASDVAPYTAGAGLSYNYQPLQLATSLQLNYTPSFSRQLDDQPYIRTLNSRTNVDLNLSKRLQKGWTVAMNVRNLLATDNSERLNSNVDGSLYEARLNESSPSYLLTLSKQF